MLDASRITALGYSAVSVGDSLNVHACVRMTTFFAVSTIMDQFLYRLVGTIGTLVTTVFVIDFEQRSLWVNIFLLIVVAYAAGFFAIDALRAFVLRPKSFNRTSETGKQQIAEYLVSQLEASGSVAIFSKDLTWVKKGSPAEGLLIKKAQAKELTLFVEHEMNMTKTLQSQGANVRVYEAQKKKGYKPKSRFTILDYRTSGTRVMVGVPSNGKHLIKHYGVDDLEVVDLAMDFIALLECIARPAK